MPNGENALAAAATGPGIEEAPKTGFLSWLNENFEKPALILGMLAIILIITYQTFVRYMVSYAADPTSTGMIKDVVVFLTREVFGLTGNITWTEETSRFIFIWISYLAIPVAIRQRSNIRVDILYDKMSRRSQHICWIMMDLLFLAFTTVVCIMGVNQIIQQMEFPQSTPALRISYSIPYMVLPVAFGLMSIRLVQDAWKEIKVAGAKSSLIALALTVAMAAPVLLYDEFDPLLLLFGYFVILLAIGVPVAVSLGLSALATILGAGTLPIDFVATTAFTSIDSFPIMAIPFFIAAGVFMGAGGLSHRLLKLADEMLGSLHGGLALATIGTCMFFAAISGSGPATVAAIGSLTIPAMVERGYDKLFAAAVVAAAGAIGVMIPPSNPFVVYGVSAQVSIGKLFLGGIMPGILTGLALMIFSYFYCRKRGWQGSVRERSLKTFIAALWDAKWALMVPVIVLGGIYGGIMTPTEAAAVAAFYGLIVGCFIYREISFKKLGDCLVESCNTSAIIIMLMAMATIFGNIMTLEDVPATIANWILSMTESKIMVLLMINVLLLIVGTFMEALAAIVILTPILLPVVVRVGVDPLHFGIIMVVNLAIGFITPPVGVNLFVASGIANAKIANLARVALPLLGIMLLILMLITYVPDIPLWLTR
ncbi:TRAP transporter large permease subunit [Desulfovibrio sp. OttesenSCG-928-C06]|nr:TRAP transporter large permease subunit [Desulfovibrio sp. OttesenSCG-928-C06]